MEIVDFFKVNPEMILRLLISVGLGGLIGFERELTHRPAGLRTHILVSLGATIFTIMSISFSSDSARIAASIVTGIGFLGAGSIIASRGHVKGITTAATIWIVASIGLAVGIGQYTIAIVGAVIVFIVLQLKKVEDKISPKGEDSNLI